MERCFEGNVSYIAISIDFLVKEFDCFQPVPLPRVLVPVQLCSLALTSVSVWERIRNPPQEAHGPWNACRRNCSLMQVFSGWWGKGKDLFCLVSSLYDWLMAHQGHSESFSGGLFSHSVDFDFDLFSPRLKKD